MMKLGYARVSTNEQDTAAQVSALKSAGCEKIFFERRHLAGDGTVPNSIACWINYERAIVLIVARLDRLSRSLRDVLAIIEKLPLMRRDFSMFIRRRCGGYWRELVPGLLE